jgi:ribonuclease P protein component
MTKIRFPRTARVRARSDFDRIFKHGRRVALPVLALHWHRPSAGDDEAAMPEPGARLGLAVSRKVDRRAVGRNRIKRVLRDSFRQHRGLLADGDYVVVARPAAAQCSGPQLREAFLGLLRRSGALAAVSLPASAAAVTMPAPAGSAEPFPSSPTPPPAG